MKKVVRGDLHDLDLSFCASSAAAVSSYKLNNNAPSG